MLMLMAQHPAVVGVQQGSLFHALEPLGRWWTSKHGYGKRLVKHSDESNSGDEQGGRLFIGDVLRPEELVDLCRPLVDHVMRKICEASGALIVVDQTPENMDLADTILRLVPDAYFVHVVRDPRAVFCSLRSANSSWAGKFPAGPAAAGRLWTTYMAKADALRASTDRYLEVRYEDLLQRGPQELARIFEWLELPADAALCHQAVQNCSIDKLRKAAVAPPSFFRKGEAAGWREEASHGQIRCIEYLAGKQMQEMGYATVSKNLARRPLRLAMQDALRGAAGPILRNVGGQLRALKRRVQLLGGI